MKHRIAVGGALLLLGRSAARAGQMGDRVGEWSRTSKFATVSGGALLLDAAQAKQRIAVFRRDQAYSDVSVRVAFRFTQSGAAAPAVGVILGSADSATFFHVHLTRTEALVYRSTPDEPNALLARRAGIKLDERELYQVRVEVEGSRVRVSLGGRLYLQANLGGYRGGAFGVYAENTAAQFSAVAATGKSMRSTWRWHVPAKKPSTDQPTAPKPATDAAAAPGTAAAPEPEK